MGVDRDPSPSDPIISLPSYVIGAYVENVNTHKVGRGDERDLRETARLAKLQLIRRLADKKA